jgi:hypothetical protein
MTKYTLNELFTIQRIDSVLFPFNLEFKPTGLAEIALDFTGLFYLFYKGELLYIGEGNSGRVSETPTKRIQKQLSTITLRGADVCFKGKMPQLILSIPELNTFVSKKLLNQLHGSSESSVNKIHFAAQHWETFAFLENIGLKHFTLVIKDLKDLKVDASELQTNCKSEKNTFLPRCNKEYNQVKTIFK